jgi:ribosomal protein S21
MTADTKTTKANVEVTKNSNESTASLIRRFTKRVQGAGILPRVRGIRYYEREPSKYTKKKRKLSSLASKEKFEELSRLGKIKPVERRGRR